METRDAERLANLTKEVVELGLALLLSPLKLLLRRLLPGATPMDQRRWAPADEGPVVGDVTITDAASQANGAPTAAPAAPARPRRPAPAPVPPSPHRDDLTGADAARLREAEREAEFGPDGPGPELRVEAPWPGYDAMNIDQVLDRLTGADPTLRAMVRLYEETHKNRKGVLRATE
jgi:hypothetical protein